MVGNWEIGGIITLHTGNALTLNEFGGWGTFRVIPPNQRNRHLLPERIGRTAVVRCTPSTNTFQATELFEPGPGYIQWFDTANVADAAPNTFGTCSVGNGRGPGLADVDLSLHKDFQFTESK